MCDEHPLKAAQAASNTGAYRTTSQPHPFIGGSSAGVVRWPPGRSGGNRTTHQTRAAWEAPKRRLCERAPPRAANRPAIAVATAQPTSVRPWSAALRQELCGERLRPGQQRTARRSNQTQPGCSAHRLATCRATLGIPPVVVAVSTGRGGRPAHRGGGRKRGAGSARPRAGRRSPGGHGGRGRR